MSIPLKAKYDKMCFFVFYANKQKLQHLTVLYIDDNKNIFKQKYSNNSLLFNAEVFVGLANIFSFINGVQTDDGLKILKHFFQVDIIVLLSY